LTSVIVPCFNQLEFTRGCVASLFRHTRLPWELIAVDNGSTDGTADYLRGVRDAAPCRVEVVTNPANRGFPAACNQGLAAARGESLDLLNNDAVVTDAWLEMLAALADSNPAIGMVGPMSNYAPPPQLVEPVPYRDLDAMHAFASGWRDRHDLSRNAKIIREGRHARLRLGVEGPAPRPMVHRAQALGVLPADQAEGAPGGGGPG
jgi:GT2 family glycosyltransferase